MREIRKVREMNGHDLLKMEELAKRTDSPIAMAYEIYAVMAGLTLEAAMADPWGDVQDAMDEWNRAKLEVGAGSTANPQTSEPS